MELIHTVDEMRSRARTVCCAGSTLALVPTMGAIHEGHLALVRRARRRADHVTVSIFVNPTQFGPDEDYESYPRTLDRDVELLRREIDGGVEVVFAPSVEEIYPGGNDPAVWVTVEELTDHLCGQFRPEHFRGVTTVVSKLFAVCRPDCAVFGRKDAQQFVILRRLAEAIPFGVEVVGVPTVREEDGLAVSSRNEYLTAAERQEATVLSEAVRRAENAIREGEQRVPPLVEEMVRILDRADHGEIEYAEIVDARTLEPVGRVEPGQEVLAAVAVYFGEARLIDSAFVTAPDSR